MKKIFTCIVISCLYIFVQAQQPYLPAPAASGNINSIEYFFDANPEFGSGTSLTGFTPSQNVTGFMGTVNLTAALPGFRRIYFRIKDAGGKWSQTNSTFFDNYNVPVYNATPSAPVNITGIEYFIDNNQMFGAGTPLTGFTSSTNINNFNGSINLTSLPAGFHRIYIRSKDANGQWSLTQNSFFDNFNIPVYNTAPVAAPNIAHLEYFIDNNDPGFGNGFPITITPNTDIANLIANVNVTGLAPGVHRLFIRSKDANGNWSLTNFSLFDNASSMPYPSAPVPVTNIVQIEYFLDNNDVGFGNCTPIAITPNTNIAGLNANINITGLAQGVHRLYIRSKDAAGKWSITNFSVFDNSAIMPYPTAPAAAPTISNMEYYIDSDPGFGNAIAITVPGNAGDISNYAININLSGSLSAGTHYLYIRSKQNPWSLTTVVPFSADGIVPVLWSFVKAQLINKQTLVSWATEQEINSQNFEIEYSTDGRTFLTIGTVPAAGNSNSRNNYSFTHGQPANGINYYRIKQIGRDGNYTYSAIVTVLQKDNLLKTLIAPNPVREILNLVEPKEVYVNTVEIYNAAGSLLMRKAFNSRLQLYSLPVNNLPAGRYLSKVNYKNGSKIYPFIKE